MAGLVPEGGENIKGLRRSTDVKNSERDENKSIQTRKESRLHSTTKRFADLGAEEAACAVIVQKVLEALR